MGITASKIYNDLFKNVSYGYLAMGGWEKNEKTIRAFCDILSNLGYDISGEVVNEILTNLINIQDKTSEAFHNGQIIVSVDDLKEIAAKYNVNLDKELAPEKPEVSEEGRKVAQEIWDEIKSQGNSWQYEGIFEKYGVK